MRISAGGDEREALRDAMKQDEVRGYMEISNAKEGNVMMKHLGLTVVFVVSAMMAFVPSGWAASSFQQQWDELVTAAEKEGELVIFLSHRLSRSKNARAFEKAFEKRFKINMKASIRGTSTQKWEKVRAERRAGLYRIDVWLGGSSVSNQLLIPAQAMDPIKPLLFHPEILEESAWFLGSLPWMDQEKRWSLGFIGTPGGGDTGYNTDLVKPDDLNSFRDFLDPKYKTTLLPRSQSVLFMWEVMGPDYMRALAKKSFIPPNLRQGIDLVATGEMHLCPWCSASEIRTARRQGLPIRNLRKGMKEGEQISVGGHTVMAMNRAPHPNAQKLFVNWLLSKDGMSVVQEITHYDTFRVDIPKDNVGPGRLRIKGRNYIFMERLPSFADKLNKATAIWAKILRGQ